MNNLETIVFDFDGVIADTYDISYALCREFDKNTNTENFLAHHDGNVYEKPKINFTADNFEDFKKGYQKRISPSHIKNAIEPIRHLAKKYKLYIISSNAEEPIHSVLQLANIAQHFEKVLGYETHKSKVAKFKILESEYGINLGKSVFVTDTLGDVLEGHKVSVPSIAVTFGFHPRERLVIGKPYVTVDTWHEVLDEIEKLS